MPENTGTISLVTIVRSIWNSCMQHNLSGKNPAAQVFYFLFNGSHGRKKSSVFLSGWILDSPVFPILAWQKPTVYIVSHGYCHIDFRKTIHVLSILQCRHIGAIQLVHEPEGIRMDMYSGLCSCGKAFKNIPSQFMAKSFGYLASAGIMHTDKRHFGSFFDVLRILAPDAVFFSISAFPF